MKDIFIYLCFLFIITISACEEIPPIITPIEPVEATPATRQILIEEFTGVRCVNCPAGTEAIEDLIDLYGDRLVVVSIHSGSFANPYPESTIDFRMPESEAILNFIGVPFGYPTAAINRKIFPGEQNLQLEGRNKWAGFVAQELATTAKLRMEITPDYNENTRALSVEISTTIEESITAEDLRLTVVIIEDDVTDTQLTPAGIQHDYVHKHVLRQVLTSPTGNLLGEDPAVGNSFKRTFSTVIPLDFKEEDVKVVAFISLSGDEKEVLQAAQQSILD